MTSKNEDDNKETKLNEKEQEKLLLEIKLKLIQKRIRKI